MANFTAEWINRLDQLGGTEFTLILSDDDEVIPIQRIQKSFNETSSTIDSTFLEAEASREIERIVDQWNSNAEGGA
jgi:hypothetical protein